MPLGTDAGPVLRRPLPSRAGADRLAPDGSPAPSVAAPSPATGNAGVDAVGLRTGGIGEVPALGRTTMPPSTLRAPIPGLRLATSSASVDMPRIWATAAPRPARHLVSSYSKASIDRGRSSGLRAIACMTRALTVSGMFDRSVI